MEAVHKSFELYLTELVKFLGSADSFESIDFPHLMQILAKSYLMENLVPVSNIGLPFRSSFFNISLFQPHGAGLLFFA